MSAGNEFDAYPNDKDDPLLGGVKKRRHTIEVPQMLEFTSTNLMNAPGPGNQITSQEKGQRRYHVTTSQSNQEDDLNAGQFYPAKVNHYEGELDRPFTREDEQFWNVQRTQPRPIVQREGPRKGWGATCYGDRNFLPLSRSTSSESCAITR